MNVGRRVFGWAAALAIGLATGCGGGAGTDRGGADVPVTLDVPTDLPGEDAVPDANRDPGPADPGGGDDVLMDAPADLVPGDEGPADPAPVDAPADLGPGDPGAADSGPEACPRLPAAADRPRAVVVSFPYRDTPGKATDWALLHLAADGTLTGPGPRFQMGSAFDGEVVFTPDGEIGIAAQDDGTLGVFKVDAGGVATVVHAAFRGGFYAARVILGDGGDHAFVLDTEWRDAAGSTERGGGVYRVDIACDGTLTDRGMVMPAKLPAALLPIPGRPNRAVLAARDVLDVMAGGDLHLVPWEDAPSVKASAAVLTEDANVDGFAITPDGRYVLIGDSGMFSDPQGVYVAQVDGDSLVPRQFLSPIGNPAAIVVAPVGGTVLVAGAYEPDDLWILDRNDGNPTAPFSIRGKVDYLAGGSQLPTAMVMLDRGPLAGRVLVTEVEGIRQVDLRSDGTVEDHGVTSLGGGTTGMPAALGIQP